MRSQLDYIRPSHRLVVVGGVALLILAVSALAAGPVIFGVNQSDLEGLGLIGLFVINFLGNSTVFVPVPGLGLAGQALIIAEADATNMFLVALVGGVAMTLAEITAYLAGVCGRALSTNGLIPLQGRFRDMARLLAAIVNKGMRRYGVPTLFALSVIPNPVFEFAGITAGATRMNFWRFLASVGLGKITRALILAAFGDAFY